MSSPDPNKTACDRRHAEQPTTALAYRRWFVLVALFAGLGPLALPLLWRSPEFSWPWKIVWTVAVLVLTVVAIWLLWVVGRQFLQLLRDLSDVYG